MTAGLIVILVLLFVTVMAFIRAKTVRDREAFRLASNARVLREFKRLARMYPEKVIEGGEF